MFFVEGKGVTVLAHYEIAVTECTVVACHRACGISTNEVKFCYWQKSLDRYQARRYYTNTQLKLVKS